MVKSPQPHCFPPSVAKKSDSSVAPDLQSSVPQEYCPNLLPGQSLDGGIVGRKVADTGPLVGLVALSPDGGAVVVDVEVDVLVESDDPQPANIYRSDIITNFSACNSFIVIY